MAATPVPAVPVAVVPLAPELLELELLDEPPEELELLEALAPEMPVRVSSVLLEAVPAELETPLSEEPPPQPASAKLASPNTTTASFKEQ